MNRSKRKAQNQHCSRQAKPPKLFKQLILALLICWGGICLLLLTTMLLSPAKVQAKERPPIVASPATPAPPQIARPEVIRLFTGRVARWADGTAVRVYLLPRDSYEYSRFIIETLGITVYEMRQMERQSMHGRVRGTARQNVENEQAMIQRLLAEPNAIGHLSDTAMVIRDETGLVVITVY